LWVSHNGGVLVSVLTSLQGLSDQTEDEQTAANGIQGNGMVGFWRHTTSGVSRWTRSLIYGSTPLMVEALQDLTARSQGRCFIRSFDGTACG
jgi:hypothetical protein